MNVDVNHIKQRCISCEKVGKETSKEHVYPQWLLKQTNTYHNPITWLGKKIPGKRAVIPICSDCNHALGNKIEEPVKRIFHNIESGIGFNDYEAELLVRWLWKITGMFYWITFVKHKYGFINLHDTILNNIEMPRNRISLAISLIDDPKEDFIDYPMGIDVLPQYSNVLAAGVFSKIALISYLTEFDEYVPENIYTKYTLSPHSVLMNPNKRINPKIGFKTGSDAVTLTREISSTILLYKHEKKALNLLRKITQKDFI